MFASDGSEDTGGLVACPKTCGGRTPSLPMDMAQIEQLPDDGGQHAEHKELRQSEQVWKMGGVPGTLDLTLILHRGQTLSSAENYALRRSMLNLSGMVGIYTGISPAAGPTDDRR